MEIKIGTKCTVEDIVRADKTANKMGSGLVDVYATPAMIALMEMAASQCISDSLQPGQASVGTDISVAHLAATPIGMKVKATAQVMAVDRWQVDFKVIAEDEAGLIGEGEHTRFIIDIEKFMKKAQEKLDV